MEQSEAFVHAERHESVMASAVSCGAECAAFRLTCDACYHQLFLSSRPARTNASDCSIHELFESTDIRDKDIRLTTCTFRRFIDSGVFFVGGVT